MYIYIYIYIHIFIHTYIYIYPARSDRWPVGRRAGGGALLGRGLPLRGLGLEDRRK